MTKTEILELIRNGENSGVEFKRDDVHPDQLAKEIAALLNLEGGVILLGVEDDGNPSGLTRNPQESEQWVFNLCRNNLQPAIIPYWETTSLDESTRIGIIRLYHDGPDKPYKARRGSAWVTFVRVGSTSREATREEEARLYQASHLMRYDIKAVPGSDMDSLDSRRLNNYLFDVLRESAITAMNAEELEKVLVNLEIMVPSQDGNMASVGGLLLFGENPNRYLPQAGITATAYPEKEKDYATVDEEIIRGPLVPLLTKRNKVVENGVIDRAVDFVSRNMGSTAWLEGGRRRRKKSYPMQAVREAVVNAVAHRDYIITVTDIELSLYSDRLEILSPGRLPNTVTVEKMKQGYRAARNELLKEILRDYGYVEHRGMGVRRKIVQGMLEHNGTEPELIEEEDRFIVKLWKTMKDE
jgi:ATP-dependent DNA helicase RecG